MTDPLTQTELMVIDYEFKRTMRELSKIIPSVDSIDYRRLTYLLIETRRAAYKEARVKRTLGNLLNDFGISSTYLPNATVSCARGFQPRVRDSINRPSLGDLKRKKNQKRKINRVGGVMASL